MSLIRPDMPAAPRLTAGGSVDAQRSGQAAFFRAAMGQAATPASAAASSVAAPVVSQPEPMQRMPLRTEASVPAGRDLRPGSLLDIRV